MIPNVAGRAFLCFYVSIETFFPQITTCTHSASIIGIMLDLISKIILSIVKVKSYITQINC